MNKILTLFLPVLFLAVACKNKADNQHAQYPGDTTQGDTAKTELVPTDTLFYTGQHLEKILPGCTSDTINCASFHSVFPLVEVTLHGYIADSINNFIRQKLYMPLIGNQQANGINTLTAPYFEAYKTAMIEAQDNAQPTLPAWRFDRKFTIFENTQRLFTIAFSEKSFAGGPHPNHYTNYYHFNPANGQQIYLENILKPGAMATLTKMAEKKFRKRLNIAPTASLEDEGFYFKENIFALPNNFRFTEKGLVLRYNNGEVGPIPLGDIELLFTYKEIENLLRDEYKPAEEPLN